MSSPALSMTAPARLHPTDPRRFGLTVTVETITPDEAKALLSKNKANRQIKSTTVAAYAKDIANDAWVLNGEPILIDKVGNLISGQHRLLACIQSGCAFTTLVVRGLDPEVKLTVDSGIKRTASDNLGMLGCMNSVAVASGIRWVEAYNRGTLGKSGGQLKVTSAEAVARWREDAQYEVSGQYGKRVDVLYPGMGTALHYIFTLIDPAAADRFFDELASGAISNRRDPVLTLRNRLIKDRLSSNKKLNVSQTEIFAFVINAWNARRSKRELTVVKGTTIGSDGERIMPTPI